MLHVILLLFCDGCGGDSPCRKQQNDKPPPNRNDENCRVKKIRTTTNFFN